MQVPKKKKYMFEEVNFMRTEFEIFKNIQTLNYFLYMDENNYIDYFNGMTTLRITMNEQYSYNALNLNFPNSLPMDFSNEMTIPLMEYIIQDLKEQKPLLKFTNLKNRWEEISTIVSFSKTLNNK